MKNYLKGWDIPRLLILALGVLFTVQGFIAKEWVLMAFGALFSLKPILGVGCCGPMGCSTPIVRSGKNKETTYEEIH